MHITTLGDAKIDTFLAIPEANLLCEKKTSSCKLCFSYGKKIPVGAHLVQFGGTAPNVAIGVKKLSHESALLTTVGTNQESEDALRFIEDYGVDTSSVVRKSHAHLTYAVVLNVDGESTQLVSHANVTHDFPEKIPHTNLLHVAELAGSYTRLYKDLVAYHKKYSVPLSVNPGTLQIQERKRELFQLLRFSSLLFVNTQEAKDLLQEDLPPALLLQKLQKLGPETVVITDGAKGAYARRLQRSFFAPSFPGVRKEATGAGDAFTSGFLGAVGYEMSINDALAWGSVNAASVIGYIGPTAGLLTRREISKRLRESTYSVKNIR